MSDRVQPGAKVDAALWERFRDAVRERHGGVRGHLRSELETALKLYIGDDAEVSSVHVNQRLARIESELGIAEADGGTDTFDADEHTHTPSGYDPETDAKPGANAAIEKKVQYLAAEIGTDCPMIPRKQLQTLVKDEYGFRKDTAKRYVDRLIEHFNLVDHPSAEADVLVSEQRRRELLEQEADEQL
jgi:hypothetical protein